MPENIDYKDTTEEFKTRLRADINTSNGEILDLVIDAIAFYLNKGHVELDPLREKYPDLICSWCGKLHSKQECQGASKKKEAVTNVLEGFDPYEIFYDSGSIGLTEELKKLSYGQLEICRKRFTSVSALPEQDVTLLVERIVKDVKEHCHQGAAFGDYKLPD